VRTVRMRAFSHLDLAFVNCLANTLSAALEWRELDATRRSLEERLHQAQRLESLGRLAGGIAHDFNNLLGVILSYSDFVAQATAGDERVQADIAEIRMAAARAAALSRQLLIFGRGDSVQAEVLDLNEVVASVEAFPDRMIGGSTQLTLHPAREPMPIRVDRGQLEQMLLNLLVNATDAMPDGGEITIETRRVEGTDLAPGSHIELAVSDSGVGMGPEVAARAFEPFFTTKRPGDGAGLGLAIVYGIVAEAGGSVAVHSEPGIGTTVEVHFPASDDPVHPAPAGRIPGHGETVLVVEDEPAILSVTARILRRNGYAVIEADSAATALELAEQHNFDLLLTDCVMPQMSGPVLADRLQEQRAGLPVVFMSGYSDGTLGFLREADEEICLVEKPFDEQALLEKIHHALSDRA
jgi:two-component system cell cycle sensor histidine kinase/response regulator CckA